MDAIKESCPTKTTLLNAWQDATETYAQAVAKLAKSIGVASRPEYERLAKASEFARNTAIRIKQALETHTDEHGCDGEAAAKPSN